MQQRARPAGMRKEDRNAVSDGNGHGSSTHASEMSIRGVSAEPPRPGCIVLEDLAAVHLARGRQTLAAKVGTQRRPATHHLANRLVGLGAEAARLASGGKGDEPELLEGVDDLRLETEGAGCWYDAHLVRRSSTRSSLAPRARSRSSMRS